MKTQTCMKTTDRFFNSHGAASLNEPSSRNEVDQSMPPDLGSLDGDWKLTRPWGKKPDFSKTCREAAVL
jgi:hypothetical protein